MSLNDIRTKFSGEITEIADDLNNSLPMSKPELRNAFTDNELKDIHALVKEVNDATDEQRKIEVVNAKAKSALNLLRKLGVVL